MSATLAESFTLRAHSFGQFWLFLLRWRKKKEQNTDAEYYFPQKLREFLPFFIYVASVSVGALYVLRFLIAQRLGRERKN